MLNRVNLIGNIGGELEIHTFEDGNKIARVSLATTENWTNKSSGDKVSRTEWHRLVFNNHSEKVWPYIKKGSMIYIEGKIKTKKYTAQDGSDRYSTEIVVSVVKLLKSNR